MKEPKLTYMVIIKLVQYVHGDLTRVDKLTNTAGNWTLFLLLVINEGHNLHTMILLKSHFETSDSDF